MKSRWRRKALVRSLLLLLPCGLGAPAFAQSVVVTNTNDSGPGSLRQAMLDALADPTDGFITFDAAVNGVITLASPLPDPQASGGDLAITGNDAANTIIDGAGQHRPFKIEWQDNLHFTLRRLTVRNGYADQGQGGAIYIHGENNSSLLTLDAVEFVDNKATYDGGAIYTDFPASVDNSLFDGNLTDHFGAAIAANGKSLLARNSTFIRNKAVSGILFFTSGAVDGPVSRLVNLTVVHNELVLGTLDIRNESEISLSNCLVTGNTNTVGDDLWVVASGRIDLTTSFNNVIGRAGDSGIKDGVNANQVGVTNPLVGSFGSYSGSTRTAPLLPGSPALDAGTTMGSDIPASDQRGIARVGMVDVGAFESQGFSATPVSGSPQSAPVGTVFAIPLTAEVAAVANIEPVEGGQVIFSAPASGASAALATPTAMIGADGRALTAATANLIAGSYTVTTALSATQTADFTLTNTLGVCGAFVFPYTLVGADNSARVAELREAIECANANATDDLIDLGGNSVVFDDNDASSAEDALPIISGGLTLRNGELQRAPGSALQFRLASVDDGAHLSVQSVTFRNGRMAGMGGAIRNDGSLDVIDSTFINNGALTDTTFGGAIFSASVDGIRISGSTFRGNAAGQGGAVHIFDGVNEIRSSHFEQNQAASRGGAVYMESNIPVRVIASRFTGNQADTGGALAYRDGVLVANSRFENNTATNGGALASLTAQTSYPSLVDNSLFVGNSASNGVVFHAVTGDAGFHNVTVVGNTTVGGAALFAANPTNHNVHIRNSILWDNAAAAVGNAFIERSIVQGGFAGGTAILDLDPRLVDAANGDYTLASASPAIDAGDNAFVPVDTFDVDEDANTTEDAPDLAGNPRRHDDPNMVDTGAGTAPVSDLGAFERQTDSAPVGITVDPASGLVTTEAGGTATFTVVLDREPTADVTVALSSSDASEATVSPTSLTFTAANWNVAQTVTVTGVDDSEVDGDVAYSIVTAAAISADANYNGVDAADVSATNADNDSAGISVNPTSGLTTTEAGGMATFTVVLTNQPTADVTLPLSSSDTTEGTVAPISLTFTTANWNVAQTVTITGVDDSEVDGDIAYNIVTAAATSSDANYSGINAADVSVTNADDDVVSARVAAYKSVMQSGTVQRPVIYHIELVNHGSGDQLDDPAGDELVDVLPPELALRTATADGGAVVVDLPGNTLRWNGVLIAGAAPVTIRIEADVTITQSATIYNQAAISYDGDGDGSNDTSGLSTDPSQPGDAVPTAFSFVGAGVPPVEPTSVPVDNRLALLFLMLTLLAGASAAMCRRAVSS